MNTEYKVWTRLPRELRDELKVLAAREHQTLESLLVELIAEALLTRVEMNQRQEIIE